MFNKFIFTTLFIVLSASGLKAQDSYSKNEVDIKLELQQERVNSKLDAVERENNTIDIKLAAQDKQIENLKFIFGILLSLIALAVTFSSIFIDKRNKERLADLEEELKTAKDDAIEELNRIKEIANLEVRMAKVELDEIRAETKRFLGKEEM